MYKKGLISVIIPSYNRKELISNAIDSVMKQTYKEIEIIIVDDCSNDGTDEYIKNKYEKEEKIEFYKNEINKGAGISRKRGYEKSHGEYIIFMDDDDYYTNYTFFEDAIKILEEKNNISFVSSSSIIEYIKENRKEESIMNIEGEIDNKEYLLAFQQKYMKSNSTFTTIFRRKSLEESGFKEVDMVNDSSIYLRALISGNAYILKDISGIYRIHSKNISNNLSIEFIIENLNEKKKICEEIKKRNILEKPEKWLQEQVKLTVEFLVKYNNISEKEFTKLEKWCKQNINCEIKTLLKGSE